MKRTSICLISAMVTLVLALPAYAGLVVKERRTTRDDDGTNTQVVETIFEGKNVRINFISGEMLMLGPGGYMLVHEDGMYMVNPGRRSYTRMSFAEMESMGRQAEAMDAQRRKATEAQGHDAGGKKTLKEFEFKPMLDEAGPTLVGYQTRHYKYRLKYKVSESLPGAMGMTMDSTVESQEEFWAALVPGLEAAEAAEDARMSMSGGALDDEIPEVAEAQRVMASKGMRLKSIVETKETSGMGGATGAMARIGRMGMGGGDTTKSTVTSEVQEIRVTDIPPGTFEVPKGYSELSMMGPGTGMPNLNNVPGGRDGQDGMPDLNEEPER